jgi:hypothetical protein
LHNTKTKDQKTKKGGLKMKVISSQRYLNENKVAEKVEELKAERVEILTLEVWEVGIDDLYILCDGHHRLAAAQELGIEVEFVADSHPDGLTGEDILEQAWIDSDWYYIETGRDVW